MNKKNTKRASDALLRDLDRQIKDLQFECEQGAEATALVYRYLFPAALDAPDGKWFPLEVVHAQAMIREIEHLRGGAVPLRGGPRSGYDSGD